MALLDSFVMPESAEELSQWAVWARARVDIPITAVLLYLAFLYLAPTIMAGRKVPYFLRQDNEQADGERGHSTPGVVCAVKEQEQEQQRGQRKEKEKKKEEGKSLQSQSSIKVVSALWNLCVAVFAVSGAAALIPALLGVVSENGVGSALCDASWTSGPTSHATTMAYWTTLLAYSKIPQLLESASLVLRKQDVSFLHGFECASVLLGAWLVLAALPGAAPGAVSLAALNFVVLAATHAVFFARAVGLRGFGRDSLPLSLVRGLDFMQRAAVAAALVLWTGLFASPSSHACEMASDALPVRVFAIGSLAVWSLLRLRSLLENYFLLNFDLSGHSWGAILSGTAFGFKTPFNKFMCVYIPTMHALALVGMYKFFFVHFSLRICVECLVIYFLCGMGVTAGMHRLWSHRSYKARLPTRVFLMLCASMSNQGSIYHWCRDHRTHHKFSDSEGDPHDSTRGFFYAHMGWLLLQKDKKVVEAGRKIDCSDLMADPVVWFNYEANRFRLWDQFWCFAVPALYGKRALGSLWDGFLIYGVLRWVYVVHVTWCVNSVAHFFGTRPFKNIPPVQSPITALLTGGEGWHNYHHAYPFDYAAAGEGPGFAFNFTKSFLDMLANVGQVYDRRVKKPPYSINPHHHQQEDKGRGGRVAEEEVEQKGD